MSCQTYWFLLSLRATLRIDQWQFHVFSKEKPGHRASKGPFMTQCPVTVCVTTKTFCYDHILIGSNSAFKHFDLPSKIGQQVSFKWQNEPPTRYMLIIRLPHQGSGDSWHGWISPVESFKIALQDMVPPKFETGGSSVKLCNASLCAAFRWFCNLFDCDRLPSASAHTTASLPRRAIMCTTPSCTRSFCQNTFFFFFFSKHCNNMQQRAIHAIAHGFSWQVPSLEKSGSFYVVWRRSFAEEAGSYREHVNQIRNKVSHSHVRVKEEVVLNVADPKVSRRSVRVNAPTFVGNFLCQNFPMHEVNHLNQGFRPRPTQTADVVQNPERQRSEGPGHNGNSGHQSFDETWAKHLPPPKKHLYSKRSLAHPLLSSVFCYLKQDTCLYGADMSSAQKRFEDNQREISVFSDGH